MTTQREQEYISRILQLSDEPSSGNAELDKQVIFTAFSLVMAAYKPELRSMWAFMERFKAAECEAGWGMPLVWCNQFYTPSYLEGSPMREIIEDVAATIGSIMHLLKRAGATGSLTINVG